MKTIFLMQDYLNNDESFTFYCNNEIIAACREMRRHYRKPLDHVVDKMLSDTDIKNNNHDSLEYQGLLAEYRFADMLDWLSDNRGWDVVHLPKMSIQTSPEMVFFPRWRVNCILPYNLGEAKYGPELDAIFRIDKYWAIGEAKSGANSFHFNEAEERVRLIQNEFGIYNPAYILAVPKDHVRNGDRKREIMKKRGIGLVTFPENSEDFVMKGKEIFKVMEERYNGNPY